MSFIKTLLRGLAAWWLSLSLFLLAGIAGLVMTLGSPAYIKTTLTKSGVYDSFVGAAMKLAYAENTTAQPGSNVADQATIKELTPIISASVTPQFLQNTANVITDATYAWLGGTQKALAFTIQTSELKDRLQTEVNSYLQNRVNGLSVCAKGQNYQNFDPLNANCKPPINVPSSELQKSTTSFIDSLPLFQQETISSGSIDVGKAKIAPDIYQWLQRMPFILLALILTCVATLVLVRRNKPRAWRTIGHTFVWAGALLVITGGLTIFIDDKFKAGFIGSASPQQLDFVNTVFLPLLHILTNNLALISLYFGIGYVVAATVCYVTSHRMRMNELREQPQETTP
jgi:hypothetical protein